MAYCENCGAEYDPTDVYDGMEHNFEVDGEMIWVNFEEVFWNPDERTLCEDCAFQNYWENSEAGAAYLWSLESGRDPVEFHRIY